MIDAAQAVLRPHAVGDRLFGDVAAVLVTDDGHRFAGVCIVAGSGTGFCAEQQCDRRRRHGLA
jgi:cytidine deaminase